MKLKLEIRLLDDFAGLKSLFQLNIEGYLFGIILAKKARKILIQFGKWSKVIRY